MALDFAINLSGTFAAALAPVRSGLADTIPKLDNTKKGVTALETEIGKLSRSTAGLKIDFSALAEGGSFFSFNIADGINAAVGALTGLVAGVWDLGKSIVHASADAQDMSLALKLSFGEQAPAIERLADSFSNTRFGSSQMKSVFLTLQESGIKDTKQLDDIATAATDLAAKKGTKFEGVQKYSDALARVGLKEQVTGKLLLQLGLTETAYYKSLAETLGVSVAEAKRRNSKKGGVASETALGELTHLIGEEVGGLGKGGLAGGKTLGATLDRLDRLPSTLFKQLSETEGLKTFQTTLDNFIETMSGDQGKELMKELGKLIADASKFLLGFLSSKDGLKSMGEAVGDLVGFVRYLAASFHETYNEIRAVIHGLELFSKLAKTVAMPQLDSLKWAENIKAQSGGALGPEELLNGLVKGLDAGKGDAKEAGGDTIAAVNQGARAKAESNSPSRLFARLGSDLTAGMVMGLDESTSEARAAARRMMSSTILATGDTTGPGRGGDAAASATAASNQISISTVVHVAAQGDAHATGEAVGAAVGIEFRKVLRSAGISLGVEGSP